MSCHKIESGNGEVMGFICCANIFNFEGFLFEFHDYLGPIPLKKNLEPRTKIKNGFWNSVTKFANLSKTDQEKYRIYG